MKRRTPRPPRTMGSARPPHLVEIVGASSSSPAARQRRTLHPAAACMLRMFVAFLLAFSGTWGVQVALAADAPATPAAAPALTVQDEGEGVNQGGEADAADTSQGTTEGGESPGSEDPSPDPEPAPQPDPEPPAPTSNYIEDLSMYVKPADVYTPIDELAYFSSGLPDKHAQLTENGGTLDFDLKAYWRHDGKSEQENDFSTDITWTLAPGDEAIASITRDTGVLQARGGVDGTVTVIATYDGPNAETGAPMEVRLMVDITGQQDTPYVVSIVICDDAGEPFTAFVFHDETLATAMVELQARVVVHDPKAPAGTPDAEYLVKPGDGLSKQTDGAIADLEWSVGSPGGTISVDGIYRPTYAANVDVRAQSYAGLGNSLVSASVSIMMPGAEGDAHPQDSLTIDVVWEAYPDEVVGSKTFSVADMEALGTQVVTYTAFGGSRGFLTFTGRGPYLAEVLRAAGVDTDGVKELQIVSYDGTYPVSWDLIVGKDRYYFPNMDIGSEAGAVQVAPMLAIDSKTSDVGSSDPVPADELNSNDRFRLLFGAGLGDEGFTTTRMQRYWINAIHVVLVGAPPVEPDEPDPKPDPDPTPGPVPGGSPATAGGGGSDEGEATPTSQASSAADEGRHNSGAWSVLQAVNRNNSDVEGLDLDNPFGPFTGAVGIGCLAAGGAEAFVRFRRETRIPM